MPRTRQQLRDIARRMDADTAEPARLAVQAAVAVTNAMLTGAVRAYRQRGDVVAAITRRSDELVRITAVAMTIAHLRGVQRARLLATHQLDIRAMNAVLRRLAAALAFSGDVVQQTREWHEKSARVTNAAAVQMLTRKVQGAVLTAHTQGMHVRSGINEIRQAFDTAGFSPRNSFTLESVFRTTANLAYSAGQYQAAQDPAIAEDHWGWTYVTVGDARVRPTHEPLDGVTLPKDDKRWDEIFPPNGHACRCKAIMVFDAGTIVEPPETAEVDGETVIPGPDPGFDFNPGKVNLGGALPTARPEVLEEA